jgi:hypothetical protein
MKDVHKQTADVGCVSTNVKKVILTCYSYLSLERASDSTYSQAKKF